MHSAALQLAPILAAEKSKVPFYIAGGLLVAWALIVSLGLGLRRVDFPGSLQAERATIAVTVVLVLGAVSTAVFTAGGTASAGEAGSTTPSAATGAPAATSSAPASTGPSSAPAATGGATSPTPSTASTPKAAAPSAATSLALVANPGGLLSYNTKTLTAKAGTVTITLRNNAPLEHDVTIAQGTKVLGRTPTFLGGSRTLTVKLTPGTYTFFCSVPGHRQAGMEGTLKVS